MAILPDRLQGYARYIVAASPTEGLVVASTEVPGFPLGSCDYTPIPEPGLKGKREY